MITGASVRLGAAAAKASQGTANYATGIDAALAVARIGLTAVKFVKIKFTSKGTGSVDEAAAPFIAKTVGFTRLLTPGWKVAERTKTIDPSGVEILNIVLVPQ